MHTTATATTMKIPTAVILPTTPPAIAPLELAPPTLSSLLSASRKKLLMCNEVSYQLG